MDDKPVRKKNRLNGFDYSSCGEYFITVCTADRRKLFWKADYENYIDCKDYTHLLNVLGKVAFNVISRTDEFYDGQISIDKFVIMPDHIHFIMTIYGGYDDAVSTERVVKMIKRSVTVESGLKNMWQKGYYDHIIRNERDYNETWEYIDANPRKLTGNIFME